MHVYNVEQSNQGVKRKRVYKIDKRFEASIERSELMYSIRILQIILAIVMIGIGASFNGKVDKEEICPNGASWWLLTAGIVDLGLNVLNLTTKIYRINVLDHREIILHLLHSSCLAELLESPNRSHSLHASVWLIMNVSNCGHRGFALLGTFNQSSLAMVGSIGSHSSRII